MTVSATWLYDEFSYTGTDYGDPEEVARYASRMGELRDFDAEAAEIMQAVDLTPGQILLELGAGTAWFALRAAAHCRFVHACDVSKPMVEYARLRAEKTAAKNTVEVSNEILADMVPSPGKGNPFEGTSLLFITKQRP